jgi:hypothetical protein
MQHLSSRGSVKLDQAIEDIKIFANTTSFLANKLETRLNGGEVKAKSKPKSRIGKAIAAPPVPKRLGLTCSSLISNAMAED